MASFYTYPYFRQYWVMLSQTLASLETMGRLADVDCVSSSGWTRDCQRKVTGEDIGKSLVRKDLTPFFVALVSAVSLTEAGWQPLYWPVRIGACSPDHQSARGLHHHHHDLMENQEVSFDIDLYNWRELVMTLIQLRHVMWKKTETKLRCWTLGSVPIWGPLLKSQWQVIHQDNVVQWVQVNYHIILVAVPYSDGGPETLHNTNVNTKQRKSLRYMKKRQVCWAKRWSAASQSTIE